MKNFSKIMISYILKVILFPLRVFRIKSDRIIFSGLTGGGAFEYTGNPKYLCEYIKENEGYRFRIIWLVSEPKRYQGQCQDIIFLKHYSLRSYYYLMTTKVIVTNGSYAPWFPFRKSQKVINTWHGGGAYKKIESDTPDASWADKKQAVAAGKNTSLFVSSCQKATELEFRGAFSYEGEVLEVGMPRNDCLVRGEYLASATKVREQYNITPSERIVLYAPTYRKCDRDIVLNEEQLLNLLTSGGQTWRLLFRAHRYATGDTIIGVDGDDYIDVTDYSDMQELLMAADMVITDYSSLIWDYSFLERPCFLYTPDVKEYLSTTGFYVGMEHWPFKNANTMKELLELIRGYNDNENKESIAEHHQFMGNRETGEACGAITKWILDNCES